MEFPPEPNFELEEEPGAQSPPQSKKPKPAEAQTLVPVAVEKTFASVGVQTQSWPEEKVTVPKEVAANKPELPEEWWLCDSPELRRMMANIYFYTESIYYMNYRKYFTV